MTETDVLEPQREVAREKVEEYMHDYPPPTGKHCRSLNYGLCLITWMPLCAAPDEVDCIFSFLKPYAYGKSHVDFKGQIIYEPDCPEGPRYCLNFALKACKYYTDNPKWAQIDVKHYRKTHRKWWQVWK